MDAAPESAPFRESASRDATFKVQYCKFWTTNSRSQNSFDLARRGEIAFSAERFVVRGFRREMLFMGTRIELAFERAHVADVSLSGNCLSFSIAPSPVGRFNPSSCGRKTRTLHADLWPSNN